MSAEVILGDCLEVMRGMADGSVDRVITDPPYARQTHEGARTKSKLDAPFIEFASITDEQFLSIAAECVRVARRWVVMTCEWRHAALAEQAGLPIVRLGVWVKENAAPQFTGDRPGMGWEAVLILHRPGKKRWNGGGYPAAWKAKVARGNHPTEKPVALLGQWVQQFTDKGELIFDPFCGSGSTGVAALGMGRQFRGVEIDPDFHAIAEKRVANAQPALLGAS